MTRQGPRLTVVATCDGCPRLATVGAWTFCRSYDPALNNDSDPDSSPGTLYGSPPVTPAWCPLLPAAREALGLLPPAFPERFAAALYASDNGNGSGALHSLLAEVGGMPYDPENDPRHNGAGQ
jgi:hypothetical protein